MLVYQVEKHYDHRILIILVGIESKLHLLDLSKDTPKSLTSVVRCFVEAVPFEDGPFNSIGKRLFTFRVLLFLCSVY